MASESNRAAAEGYTLTRLVLVPNASLCEERASVIGSVIGVDVAPERAKVVIGSKWTPGTRTYRNDITGERWVANPKLDTETDIHVQRALLKRVAPNSIQAKLIEHALNAKRVAGGVR